MGPVQGPHRRLRQDPQVRRYPGALPRLRHFLRRHLRLPWNVLRPLRFPQAHPFGTRRRVVPVLLPGLRCHRHFRPDVLPHRHHPSSYDDDLWYRRQVQGLRRLRRSNLEERGLYVHDEGCRSQHPSRSRWRRCLGRLRFLQEALHRLAYWISLGGAEKRVRSTNPLWYLTFYSVLSDDSRSAKPGATRSNNHQCKTRLSRLLYGHFYYYSKYFKLVKFPIFKL